MTNEDRIASWRLRREAELAAQAALPGLDRNMAAIAASVGPLAHSEPLSGDELLSAVLAALRPTPGASNAERRQIYDAVAMGLDTAGQRMGLARELIELHGRQLRILIRLLEGDLRAGGQIFAPSYRPDQLDEAMRRLEDGYQRQRRRAEEEAGRAARRQAVLAGEAFAIAVRPDEEADLIYIRRRLAMIDATRGDRAPHPDRQSLGSFAALFLHQYKLLQAESRLALLWTFIGPAVLLSLISSLYLLSGSRYVLNMDVGTFSMLGATTWIMFRNIIFRTSTALYSQRALLNVGGITSGAIGLAQALIYFIIYVFVFLVLIFGGNLIGVFSLPNNWIGFIGWVAAMGMAGTAVGVIFGAIAVLWPFFLRFAPVIERGLQLFSSVFFVSEELPKAYRGYILWSPFAHAMQLMRSAYFVNYKSEDANAEYFFVCLGILILVAFVAQRAVRSRTQPV
jgi:ABC-type polysaccharide/polyol phosphate export permease